jgi:hypothetical protein
MKGLEMLHDPFYGKCRKAEWLGGGKKTRKSKEFAWRHLDLLCDCITHLP